MLEGYKTKKIGIVRADENINKNVRVNVNKGCGKDEDQDNFDNRQERE